MPGGTEIGAVNLDGAAGAQRRCIFSAVANRLEPPGRWPAARPGPRAGQALGQRLDHGWIAFGQRPTVHSSYSTRATARQVGGWASRSGCPMPAWRRCHCSLTCDSAPRLRKSGLAADMRSGSCPGCRVPCQRPAVLSTKRAAVLQGAPPRSAPSARRPAAATRPPLRQHLGKLQPPEVGDEEAQAVVLNAFFDRLRDALVLDRASRSARCCCWNQVSAVASGRFAGRDIDHGAGAVDQVEGGEDRPTLPPAHDALLPSAARPCQSTGVPSLTGRPLGGM